MEFGLLFLSSYKAIFSISKSIDIDINDLSLEDFINTNLCVIK